MFRFTIRDALLLTALAAVIVAWHVDARARDLSRQATRAHAERLRESLDYARGINAMLRQAIDEPNKSQCWQVQYPDWDLITQPIP
jgi:hypothetical protein